MGNKIEHASRTPWERDFPDVVTFCDVAERDGMKAYAKAKYAKNTNYAGMLMEEIGRTKGFKDGIKELKKIAGGKEVIIVPIHSLEIGYDGRSNKGAIASNPLPMAIAMAISDETGWQVDTGIIQNNIVGHSGADNLTRFAFPALFEGDVQQGKNYLIVDDHVSMGGTVANCRGHIETNGGKVIGISALTSNRGGRCVRLTQTNKNRMENAENFATIGCHSHLFDKVFGFPVSCLTNSEAGQIIHHLKAGKEKKPGYTVQHFFDEVIKHRKQLSTDDIKAAKKEICTHKLGDKRDGRYRRGSKTVLVKGSAHAPRR